jgi:hypothetical protein
MFALLVFSVSARSLVLDHYTISKFVLENGDTLSINGFGRQIYIDLQSYFFRGTLTFSISDYTGNPSSQIAEYGSRYFFSDSMVNLSFTDSATTCTLGLYVLHMDCDPTFAIHSRSLLSARAHIDKSISESICWFFRFDRSTPTFAVSDPTAFDVFLLNSSSQGLIVQPLNDASQLERMFVLRANPNRIDDAEVNLVTEDIYSDWNEVDRTYQVCTLSGCLGPQTLDVTQFLESRRGVEWWIWTCLYGLSSLVVVLFSVFLLIPPKTPARTMPRVSSEPLMSSELGNRPRGQGGYLEENAM